jgi:hypothetical protein
MGGGVGLLAVPRLGGMVRAFVSAEGGVGVPVSSLVPRLAKLPYWMFAGIVLPLIRFGTRFTFSWKIRATGVWVRRADERALYKSTQSLRAYSCNTKLLSIMAELPSKIYLCGSKGVRLQRVVPSVEAQGIDVQIIADAGHVMMLDNPDGFYHAIAMAIKR